MGLTKPRAAQIYNIDYKQATRVVTVANVVLAGGAPSQVDGVNLTVDERVLVTGQSDAKQNGLYYVDILGTGSNGTWLRTSDSNETGELEAGTIVMVTEGATYADTQWKLISDNPIIIGTTLLVFTQNYSANSISAGSSNVSVQSNANVTISSAGTANVVTVASTGAYITGTLSASGNVFGRGINSYSQSTAPTNPSVGDFWYNTSTNSQYRYTFDGTDYFWLDDFGSTTAENGSFNAITSGTSNVSIYSANANVQVSVAGTGNIAVFSTTGAAFTGLTVTTSGTPATSSSAGITGQIQWDSNYVYVCVAPNTWKRANISTW
jgi:hypothetical protein